MKLITELKESKLKVLIVDRQRSVLTLLLKSVFNKYDWSTYLSPVLPPDIQPFSVCFLINEKLLNRPVSTTNIVYIYLNYHLSSQTEKSLRKQSAAKAILIDGDRDYIEQNLDNIVWFALSKSSETFLKLQQPLSKKTKIPTKRPPKIMPIHPYQSTRLRLILFIFIGFIILHMIFVIPLAVSSFLLYKTTKTIKRDFSLVLGDNLSSNRRWFNLSKILYGYVRPTWLLFSMAGLPDNLISINEKALGVIDQAAALNQIGRKMFQSVIKKHRLAEERLWLTDHFDKLPAQLDKLEEDLHYLNQKLPAFFPRASDMKIEIGKIDGTISQFKKITPLIPVFLAKDTEKQYLFLMANNMELRPGGGFIGSFAILKFKDLGLTDLQIYDVYDADGQLIAHFDPPNPIKTYLNQPHWFLRDSAFSPDWLENYTQAKFFLDKEIHFSDFNGGILMTTSALQNILEAYGDLYLPDFNEVINKNNFYLKAQLYSEKNFFPGSTQKKSFLSSLTRQLLTSIDQIPISFLLQNLKKSLDEKQIVAYFDEISLQQIIDAFYWSGRIVEPNCPSAINVCTSNYLFPYDANLGVNKANFFISRYQEIKTIIAPDGAISTIFSNHFKNESNNNVFPGGNYRNYFQILLPKDAQIDQVTKNGVLIQNFDWEKDRFQKIGLLLDIPPKTETSITVAYQLNKPLAKGRSIYQLLLQKQTGSSNNDINFQIQLPDNISLINQNFSPLVKNKQIVYNTTLSADKIFFLELLKQ